MRVLVTGATGFAGSLLIPRLHREGHDLRAMARDPTRLRIPLAWDIETVRGDVVSGDGLDMALGGIEVAYYLIHSMDGASGRDFPAQERRGAENFAAAAKRADIGRIVYLGGPLPKERAASRHLASRLQVERILLDAIPDSVALRAAIVIGARSRSFRFMVRLIERMPVLALPAWQRYRSAPIDERDVIMMLANAAHEPAVGGMALDIGGPDILSYGEMLARIADLMLVGRPLVGLPVNATPITGRVAAAIAAEDPELVLPLMESLGGDLLPADERAAQLLDVHLHSFERAVEHALAQWEAVEPLVAH